jgi:hypothetical protein
LAGTIKISQSLLYLALILSDGDQARVTARLSTILGAGQERHYTLMVRLAYVRKPISLLILYNPQPGEA